jgi:hypothetical protein
MVVRIKVWLGSLGRGLFLGALPFELDHFLVYLLLNRLRPDLLLHEKEIAPDDGQHGANP